jgi:hypothetical protein
MEELPVEILIGLSPGCDPNGMEERIPDAIKNLPVRIALKTPLPEKTDAP